MTQEELGKKIGATTVTVWRWESDQRTPRADFLDAIATALGVSVSDLVPSSTGLNFPPNARPLTEGWYELPILSPTSIACAGDGNGGMHGITLETSRTICVPREWLGIISIDTEKRPYGVRVEGESMAEANIPDGAEVAINPAEEVREGDPALVCFGVRGDWAIKWVHFHRDGSIELRSASNQYPPKIYSREDVENGFIRIIGRVMGSLSMPKRNI